MGVVCVYYKILLSFFSFKNWSPQHLSTTSSAGSRLVDGTYRKCKRQCITVYIWYIGSSTGTFMIKDTLLSTSTYVVTLFLEGLRPPQNLQYRKLHNH